MRKNKVKNTQIFTQLYDKIDAKHRVTDWLNKEQRTPQVPPRRSVSDMREISRVPAFALILAERQDSRVGTLSQETGIKNLEEKELKTLLRKRGSVSGEDSGPTLNIVMKTKIGYAQPKSLLRRSLSDLKQKSITARNFLNLSDVRENVGRSAVIWKIDDNSNDLRDNDEKDTFDNKENIVIDDVKVKVTDQKEVLAGNLGS